MTRILRRIYDAKVRYSFRTIFGNSITVRISDGMYIVEEEEEEKVPERMYEKYLSQELKPSMLVTELLSRDDLTSAQKYYIFKKLTFGIFTVPILDPDVKNININDRCCMLTHNVVDVIYAVKYAPSEVEKVRFSLEKELEKTCSLTNPILEGSVAFLDFVMRISVTARGLGVAPMTQISIRKHSKSYYTLVDQIKSKFINSTLAALLATNWAFPISSSVVVCGPMGSRKTSLLGCLIQFVEPNCIVGILQDDPELDIRELPGMYIEWHCARKTLSQEGVREIQLVDLIRAALRKNYRKIIISEVRSPDEIYAYIQLLKVTYGAGTTIHALSIDTLQKRLLSAKSGVITVDKYDLEPIKLAVICGFAQRRPKVLQIAHVDFVNETYSTIAKFAETDWIVDEEKIGKYLEELAEINNIPRSETKAVFEDLRRFLELMRDVEVELDAYMFRKYILDLYKYGLDYVKSELIKLMSDITVVTM